MPRFLAESDAIRSNSSVQAVASFSGHTFTCHDLRWMYLASDQLKLLLMLVFPKELSLLNKQSTTRKNQVDG